MAGYSKQAWVNGSGGATPINATRLGHMEDGIFDGSLKTGFGNGSLHAPSGEVWSNADQTIANETETFIYGLDVSQFLQTGSNFSVDSIYGADPVVVPDHADGALAVEEPGLYEVMWEVDWDDAVTTGYRVAWLKGYTSATDVEYPGYYGELDRMIFPGDCVPVDPWMIRSTVVRVWGPSQFYMQVWQNSGSAVDVTFAEIHAYKII